MKIMGGFFEVEIRKSSYCYHERAVAFSNGRACLNFLISQIHPKKIYVPFYTCDSLFEPMVINKVSYEYYPLNINLEPLRRVNLNEGEYFVYINYFGLKNDCIRRLIADYGDKVIVDNTQAFLEKGYTHNWSFNSARKFFGVPDGGYLYAPYPVHPSCARNLDIGYDHLVNRLLGKQEQAYQEFVANEQSYTSDIKRISVLSECLLSNVDYEYVSKKRRENFQLYYETFSDMNHLKIDWDTKSVPFFYPLLLEREINREELYKQNIFIPTFWKDTLERGCTGFEFEKEITKKLLPLPVDQRYDSSDVKFLIQILNQMIRS